MPSSARNVNLVYAWWHIQKRNHKKMDRKINILLDLDNTLISSLSTSEEKKRYRKRMDKYRWEDMDGYYKVFERPGLQPFLDFLFKNFNVSVWTAASKTYALFIIDKFLLNGKPERKLDYIFFSHHCRRSKRVKSSQKSLDILEQEFHLSKYKKKHTYIIDDHPEVYETQPERCIQIKPFEFVSSKSYRDRELVDVIQPKLEKLLEAY